MQKAGIPLVELFDIVDQSASALPKPIQDFVNRFAVVDFESTRAAGAIIHHGVLQALGDSLVDVCLGHLYCSNNIDWHGARALTYLSSTRI